LQITNESDPSFPNGETNCSGYKARKFIENIKYITQILWRRIKIFNFGTGKNWELYWYPNLKVTDKNNITEECDK
jgi:hypothetical protein